MNKLFIGIFLTVLLASGYFGTQQLGANATAAMGCSMIIAGVVGSAPQRKKRSL
ncbi:hypothetical protein NOS3756_30080 [Nostoc sp. NIES-3756]|uniref:hypothetical protein n=1 Tax=Nostoc sp. NIES-3756 TaxID=1751286 RepID=UPI0007225F07|nr:hypothetical protein [Nostoc sp. NIES-3756]BAT54043.1 hypothetical protein NOS3756_30080 [Nostoc sp. NIES-3756]BAY38220.1 hypothetical protein NIES2111_25650 [Nostoc sp. NIES-2111]